MRRLPQLLLALLLLYVVSGIPSGTPCSCEVPVSASAAHATAEALAGPGTIETAAVSGTSEVVADAAISEVSATKFVVFYCMTTMRCPSCRKIEAWGKAAVEKGFADEMKSGKIEWRMVALDEPGNAHFAEDFQLYTKSIVVAEERGGKILRWKNLDKIWELLGNEGAYTNYVTEGVRAFLDGK